MRYSNPTQPSQVFFKHYDIIRNAGLCVCVPLDEYHLCLSTVIGHYCMKNIVCCKITWPTNLHSVLTYFDQTLLDYFDRFCILFSSPGPKVQVNYCHHLASVVCKLFTFQASSQKPLGRLEPNLAGMFLGWSSTKFFVPVGYSIWLPGPIICSDWLKFQRSSSLKLMN